MRKFFLLTILLSINLIAQQKAPEVSVPRVIRFNATLSAGPQAGMAGVLFSIFRDQFDGAPVWSEVQNVQTDKTGSYSVLLGATRNEGLPLDLFNTTEPRWLEVEINGVKEPRILIGSVPYAMVAFETKTLGGLPPSAYLRADSVNPNVKTTNLLAVPNGVKADIASGSAGYLALFTNDTDLGNSVLYQNGSKISIGGTTSLGAMTLIGSAPFGDTAGMALYNQGGGAGASVSLDMYNTGANGGIPQAKIKAVDDGSYSDHLTFWTKNPGGAANPVVERMRITSNGNVGIGTTTPTAQLEVAGDVKVLGLIFPDGTTQTTGLGSTAASNTFVAYSNQQQSPSYLAISNVSIGNDASNSDRLGNRNVALGDGSLFVNTNGSNNTALGSQALSSTTDSNNVGIGIYAGASTGVGNYNIDMGDSGTAYDSYIMRLGGVQTQAFIAGIFSANVAGVPVLINGAGQLGIANSSRRYKEDIQDIGAGSDNILRLRPVTYHYKQPFANGSKTLEYGLIAEEVADLFPELVLRGHDGQVQTVMYQKLMPMLLNQVQQLNRENAIRAAQLLRATEEVTNQQAQIVAMREQLKRLESLTKSTKGEN